MLQVLEGERGIRALSLNCLTYYRYRSEGGNKKEIKNKKEMKNNKV